MDDIQDLNYDPGNNAKAHAQVFLLFYHNLSVKNVLSIEVSLQSKTMFKAERKRTGYCKEKVDSNACQGVQPL